jgi:hypothetical protein
MDRIVKSGVFIVVLAFTLPFITYWIPAHILQTLIIVVLALGILSAILLVPVWLFLYVINSFKR